MTRLGCHRVCYNTRTMVRSFALAVILFLYAPVALAGPLHVAASLGDTARITAFLKQSPELANLRDENGATMLHWAVDGNQKAVVELLLAAGAQVDARKRNGVTPLHVAVALNRSDLAQLLLDKGANVNAKDKLGRTPLALARRKGVTAIITLLQSRASAPPAIAPSAEASVLGGKPMSWMSMTVRDIPVNLIYIRLDDPRIRLRPAIAAGGVGSTESFGSFVHRLNPTAAINGTFFCKETYLPIGDIVIDNRLAYFGGMGTGICIAPGNKVEFIPVLQSRHTDWSKYETVVCSGPRLLLDNRIVVDPRTEGFHDPHVLGSGRRTAIGLTSMNRLLLLNTKRPCSLSKLAYIMRDLDCIDAVNLDGGSSVAMYYRGRTITHPSRALTNLLLVYEDSQSARME